MNERLHIEYVLLNKHPICESKVYIEDENTPYTWTIVLPGPKETPYENGIYKLKIKFEDYPYKAPDVIFVTPIYHPNVEKSTGALCEEIYLSSWTPLQKIEDIIFRIYSMLRIPCTNKPMEPDICKEYLDNPKEFEKKARDYTTHFALKNFQVKS